MEEKNEKVDEWKYDKMKEEVEQRWKAQERIVKKSEGRG